MDSEEQRWIERFLSKELQQPVSLDILLKPMLEPLMFAKGETGLTSEHEAVLREAGKLFKAGAGSILQIESQPESRGALRYAKLRLEAAKRYLADQCAVPPERIKAGVARAPSSTPSLVLTFINAPDSSRQAGNEGAH